MSCVEEGFRADSKKPYRRIKKLVRVSCPNFQSSSSWPSEFNELVCFRKTRSGGREAAVKAGVGSSGGICEQAVLSPASNLLVTTEGVRMLRRKPTRLELKAEDKEEYDEAKRRAAAAARAASTAGPAASALLDHHPKPSVNQRIGLYK